jgi:hypothetical protein
MPQREHIMFFSSFCQQNVAPARLMRQQRNALIFLPEIELDELYHLGYFANSSRMKNK